MRLAARALCLATLFCSLSPTLHAQAYKSSPRYKSAISDAKLLAENQDYDDAIASYQEANEIAGGKDKTSLRAILDLQIANGSYDDAIATSRAFKIIATTPTERSYAEASRGHALFLKSEPQSGSQYNLTLLNAADAAFKDAISIDPKNTSALFMDGQVLVHLGQIEPARVQFKACLTSLQPDDPIYNRTQRFAKDPSLALQQLAPAFTVTTLNGSSFNLDQMNGHVVLIDFWATWCVPCLQELPHIKQIAKDFAGQPLVILSVSWDEDPQAWKTFIQKNGMVWPQYRDTDHKLGQLFQVEALPSYFTIDSEGVIASELLGEGFDVEGRLRKLITQAKANQAAHTPIATGN